MIRKMINSAAGRGLLTRRSSVVSRKWQVIFVTCLCVCLPSVALSTATAVLSDVKYISTESTLTVNLMLSGTVKYAEGRATNPDRYFVDLKGVRLGSGLQKNIQVNDSFVKTLRVAQYAPDTVRVVMDLSSSFGTTSFTISKGPSRITVIVKGRLLQETQEQETTQKTAKTKEAESGTAKSTADGAIESISEEHAGAKALERPIAEPPPARHDMAEVAKALSAHKFFFSRRGDGQEGADEPAMPDSTKRRESLAPSFLSMDFKGYLEKVMNANPTVKMSEQDYKKSMIIFLRDLQNYDFKVSLNSSPSYTYEGSSIQGSSRFNEENEYGINAYLYVTKNLYDGGKKQILEKERDVFRALSQADQLQKNDTVLLTAVNYYANFYYQQQVREFLTQQFTQYRHFQEQVEKRYQRGVRFTSYDLLTTQADSLRLERGLIDQKAGLIKVETAFRQYGHIYTDLPLRLEPFEADFIPEIESLQKYAAVHNSAVHATRLKSELQGYKVKEREAEGGLKVDVSGAVGWQAGAGGYTGTNNLLADAYLNFTLPLYDGGVIKSNVMAEKIELVKQKLALQKVTDDTLRMLTDLYVDYKNFEASMAVLKQLIDLDEKRLRISLERLEKGLDDYRAVRDSWREFIDAKMEYLRQAVISQKILVDLSILSGKKIVN